jgi:broad specificity phosphatase PhoE
MELVLVRHAQPQWYVDDLHQGQDPGLSELGFRQAELVGEKLANEHFDHILVSPMLRAQQTAVPLLNRLGREMVIAPWLREIADPAQPGQPRDEIEALYNAEEFAPLDERWAGLPGGERIDAFHTRIHDGLVTFLEQFGICHHDHEIPSWTAKRGGAAELMPGPRILCVAHGGTNAVITGLLLGAAAVPYPWRRFWYEHTTIGRLTALATSGIIYFALQGLETPHLERFERSH